MAGRYAETAGQVPSHDAWLGYENGEAAPTDEPELPAGDIPALLPSEDSMPPKDKLGEAREVTQTAYGRQLAHQADAQGDKIPGINTPIENSTTQPRSEELVAHDIDPDIPTNTPNLTGEVPTPRPSAEDNSQELITATEALAQPVGQEMTTQDELTRHAVETAHVLIGSAPSAVNGEAQHQKAITDLEDLARAAAIGRRPTSL